jgi:hypothetical protein
MLSENGCNINVMLEKYYYPYKRIGEEIVEVKDRILSFFIERMKEYV